MITVLVIFFMITKVSVVGIVCTCAMRMHIIAVCTRTYGTTCHLVQA